MKIGILQMHLFLPGCTSLKEKRGRIKPLLSRLHQEFNVTIAEIDLQDTWQEALIGCAIISNDSGIIHKSFEKIKTFTESFFTEIILSEDKVEIL